MSKSLNELCDEAFRIAVEHGFTDASVGEDIALMHSELSELLEDYRNGLKPLDVYYVEKVVAHGPNGAPLIDDFGKMVVVEVRRKEPRNPDGSLRKPCGPASELADEIIRVAHFCGKHGIDIEKAVDEKMAFNASRPYKHGGKKV